MSIAPQIGMAAIWKDISVPLHKGLVHWPDNPPFTIEPALSLARGDVCNVSRVSLGTHTGTHLDAPYHFVDSGQTIDEVPLSVPVGPARVIEIRDRRSIEPSELIPHRIQQGERILFRTRNSATNWASEPFHPDFVSISVEAAAYLAECRVKLVGVDYLSAGSPETHRTLFASDVWILEGLSLTDVAAGRYDLVCLPLRIVGADGAPARAILRERPVQGPDE